MINQRRGKSHHSRGVGEKGQEALLLRNPRSHLLLHPIPNMIRKRPPRGALLAPPPFPPHHRARPPGRDREPEAPPPPDVETLGVPVRVRVRIRLGVGICIGGDSDNGGGVGGGGGAAAGAELGEVGEDEVAEIRHGRGEE